MKKKLGEGNFGDVFLGTWANTKVALKQLKNAQDSTQINKEIDVLKTLNHPHIVKMFGIYKGRIINFNLLKFFYYFSLFELINIKLKFISLIMIF